MQRRMKVPQNWCEYAMCRGLCVGCSYFDGREISEYQRKKAKGEK